MSTRILFVCTANSARSQMAEGLARALAVPHVEIVSAGTHPAGVNPLAISAMRERGIDISAQRSKRVEDVPGPFDYVITLCDDAAQNCPFVPSLQERIHWGLLDPAAVPGDDAARLTAFRVARDEIERRLRPWLASLHLLDARP